MNLLDFSHLCNAMSELEIQLKKENQNLKTEAQKAAEKIHYLECQLSKQQHQIEQLLRQLYGKKSEKLPVQPTLFDTLPFTEEELAVVSSEETKTTVPSFERKKPNQDPNSLRNKLPDHLRREEVIIEPKDLPEGAVRIGEEISEKLESTKAELYVKRIIRPKYALPDKSGITIAELPEFPFSHVIAGLTLLIRILIDKYVDHIPLNRQLKRMARQGVVIKDSTIGDWVTMVSKLLSVLYSVMEQEILDSNYLGADETSIKVLDPKLTGKSHQGYFWVYMAHDKKLVYFDYHDSRGKAVVGDMLKNYTGNLQTDAYGAYAQFSANKNIVRVGCMAHARRKFDEAKSNDQVKSMHVLAIMQRVYRLEHLLRQFNIDVEGKKKLRQKIALPMLKEMFSWMKQEITQQRPSSPIYKALQYTLKIEKELMEYTENGSLHIDNNLVENSIRPIAIGRKNYMFMGSHEGARRSAMLYSFMLSCKLNGINEEEWLEDVLCRINSTKQSELVNLLPHRWKKSA